MTFRRFLARTIGPSILVLVATCLIVGNAALPILGLMYGMAAAFGPVGFVVTGIWTFMGWSLLRTSRSISDAESSIRNFVIIGPVLIAFFVYTLAMVNALASRPLGANSWFYFALTALFAVVCFSSVQMGLWWKHQVLLAVFEGNSAAQPLSERRWDRPRAIVVFPTAVAIFILGAVLSLTLYSSATLYSS